MRIVVVDNGGQWTHREWRVLRDLGADARILPNTSSVDDILDADGIVLSGGAPRVGLADSLGNCAGVLDRSTVPVLGICAGHQFMGRHFGGEVAPAKTPEFGRAIIEILAPGTILEGVPSGSVAWESHNDEVTVVPDQLEVLARSPACSCQAMRHRTKPFYGLQFHPEVTHTEHGERIFQNFLGVCKR